MQLILNEYNYILNIIDTCIVPKDLSKSYLINMLGKYYFTYIKEEEIIVNTIKTQMKKFDFSILEYQEYKWIGKIRKSVKDIIDNDLKLRNLKYVPLYESEFKMIDTYCETDKEKKLLFVMYILARFYSSNGWINTEIKNIFKYANISTTTDKQDELLKTLLDKKLISCSKRSDNLNLRIDLSNGINDKVVFEVSKFDNLGNQYLGKFKEGYKQCVECGKLVKITGNRTKYCKLCYKKINSFMTNERQKTNRNIK